MRPTASYLVRIPSAGMVAPDLLTIYGPTFFLARAEAARKYNVDPTDIRPAIRFTVGKSAT